MPLPFDDKDNVGPRARKTVDESYLHTGRRKRYDDRAWGEVNREMGLYVFSPPTEVGCQVSALYVKTFDFSE